jgi:FMN phosphatase YigB (HAD superfamily)
LSEISAYCRGSNHTIRGEKFRHVCDQILKIVYTPELERDLHARYAAYTTDAVAQAKEIRGAEAFVRLVGETHPTALLSSTPHAILLEILGRKGWLPLFQEIQGAPVVKRDWLSSYQLKLHCLPADILFFGDTAEDEGSARAIGCEFVRVGVTIPDFSGLRN